VAVTARRSELGGPAVDLLGAIKKAVDTLDLMNPGKIV